MFTDITLSGDLNKWFKLNLNERNVSLGGMYDTIHKIDCIYS